FPNSVIDITPAFAILRVAWWDHWRAVLMKKRDCRMIEFHLPWRRISRKALPRKPFPTGSFNDIIAIARAAGVVRGEEITQVKYIANAFKVGSRHYISV